MIRQWGHGHSLAGGFFVALLVDRHVLYVFALGLLIGGLVVYSSRTLRALGRSAAKGTRDLVTARVMTERERRANLRASRLVKLNGVKAKRVELDKAYQRGYIEAKLEQ